MRNEIITRINDLFDENIDLKVRNEYLENIRNEQERIVLAASENDCSFSILDNKLLEYGKKTLKKEVFRNWGTDVSVKRDEATKELVFESFEEWVNNNIREDEIPENMSKEDVKKLIYKYALEEAKEKAKAIKVLEERKLKERDTKENE